MERDGYHDRKDGERLDGEEHHGEKEWREEG